MSDSEMIGVVGGGQLGRMLAEAAAPLGVEVVVLDPTSECPASPVARDQIVGDFDDEEGIRELAARADYLTYEIELADPDVLERVADEYDVPVNPDPETLRTIQDKLVQNRALRDAGVPVPDFRRVDDREDLLDAIEEFGYPVMLKAREGGYDGRGNVPVADESEVEDALEQVEGGAVVEEFVDFEREVSIIGVKGTDGETATFPLGENVHREEILRETVVPARTSEAVAERAREVAEDVLEMLSGRGVYGIELFETSEGEILVNEIAPRPHNSGHYTIEGALTSQFEQHARAVTGRPLGATDLRSPVVSANLLGDGDERRDANPAGDEAILAHPGASIHWYGKHEVYPLRKMGHFTVVGEARSGSPDEADDETTDELLRAARDLRDEVTFE
ncbi:5-(carboxyamino)imidazole ribonucleotide synthase [Halorussus gelatinilyticus]|uniref:N5-carboxyaminoimidazole ribonucleotide synthase n=1 Tax=Halorussus gelatinilyticus TaxID=2937524 RepID=A0A8U0IEU8_9EURY|nr:5-(carboxyamino)imidazole ribonucleotide synthase [Halorussus gelatinilyticus]UPV99589.1 5-(carboxyamino)imidazole ribonucleotide synthase [Halorussus gelatinilyticus]